MRTFWLIVGGVLACLIVAILVANRNISSESSQRIEIAPQPKTPVVAAKPQHIELAPKAADNPPPIVDDDGKTLWVSPTNGKPLGLGYLPPGAQIIVAARPAALLKNAERNKVVAALGPLGKLA